MHVNAKKMAFSGMLLAITVVFMYLGSVIETNTLFLLAAASYFVGIMIREMGLKTGAAFYIAAVLLGVLLAPNKFYVFSYSIMGFYILMTEILWRVLGRMSGGYAGRMGIFWTAKYVIFNLIYLPILFLFPKLIFAGELSGMIKLVLTAAGQIGLFVYDRAYDYVQTNLWGKIRHRFIQEF